MSRPKGILVAIGGAEDKKDDMKVLRRVLDLVGKEAETVEILPIASGIPDEAAEPDVKAFEDLGVRTTRVLDVRSCDEVDREEHAERISEADLVYFTGGSPLLDAIHEKYREGGVIAGTSAGAAAMSATMIFQGAATDGRMRKGNVLMTPGLGLLPHAVVDTHFVDRGRFCRLLEVVASNPSLVGIGIGEDTAIVVRDNFHLEVVGKGLGVLVDGMELRHSNIADVATGDPISTERMIVHTLGEGYEYNIREREYIHASHRGQKVRA